MRSGELSDPESGAIPDLDEEDERVKPGEMGGGQPGQDLEITSKALEVHAPPMKDELRCTDRFKILKLKGSKPSPPGKVAP
jgi:hypothetical protein